MHILVIPSWYTLPERPMRGIFFREQAEALLAVGHQVGVITYNYHSIKTVFQNGPLPSISYSSEGGMPIYRIRLQNFYAKSKQLHLFFHRLASLAAYQQYIHEQGRPDLIQAHSILYGGYIAVCALQKYGIPVVITEHSTAFLRGMIDPEKARVSRLVLKDANKICAVGKALAKELQNYAPGRTVDVVGNMVDGDFFQLSTLPRSAGQPFVFASLAIIEKKKGLDILLYAFSKACKARNVLLRLGGSGEELQNLKNLAHELGIQDQVQFLGELSRDGVRELIRHTHVMVSSSYVETFGVTVIEALASGRPVVVTNSGGPEDFVDTNNGLIVPPGDASALAEAMERMIDLYSDYNPARIRANILAKYGRQAFVRRMESIYQDVTH